jgi:hypothetical protein
MMKDLTAASVLETVALSAPVRAEYPDRPVCLIVPFAPGSANDSVARLLSDKLGKVLSQSVIVENRPGGGTVIDTAAVVSSPPDGYTLLLVSPAHTINPHFQQDFAVQSAHRLRADRSAHAVGVLLRHIGARSFIESSQVRALAVSSDFRVRASPDIPTVSESGVADYVVNGGYGVIGPSGLPAEVVARLEDGSINPCKIRSWSLGSSGREKRSRRARRTRSLLYSGPISADTKRAGLSPPQLEPFPQRSPRTTTSACGGLRSTAECRTRKGLPSSLVQFLHRRYSWRCLCHTTHSGHLV